ncbi:hypothetical protein [Bacillus kexueae]|nr:hypothetical protein [Bacillus kexueae]
MNIEIFLGLFGIPLGIILLAMICYIIEANREKRNSSISNDRGVSQ